MLIANLYAFTYEPTPFTTNEYAPTTFNVSSVDILIISTSFDVFAIFNFMFCVFSHEIVIALLYVAAGTAPLIFRSSTIVNRYVAVYLFAPVIKIV